MPRNISPRFCKSLIALAVGAALAPHSALALDLSQAPPGTVEPYVTPNVLITFDDSGSMKYWIDATTSGTNDGIDRSEPNTDGTWPINTQRISVLKYAVKQVFNDTLLLPNKKIRLAWQSMWNNGNGSGNGRNKSPGADNLNTSGNHNIRILNDTHRKNFTDFVGWMLPSNGTPTHKMTYQAHSYMTGTLNKDSPWASVPGTTAEPYLGCRRNYHILMSDGGWQTAPTTAQKPGNTDGSVFNLPDGTPYNKVLPYADTQTDMVADWAFKSWSTNLQPSSSITGAPQPTADYRKAPETENFGQDTSTPKKNAILNRYWNPRYNPATWPHMVTYTIGFSKAATTWTGEPNIKRPPDTDIVPFSYNIGKNGSLPDFITGKIAWPPLTTGTEKTKNALDLWHAAINGRGRYYAVEKGEDLEKAFREIFGQINTLTDPDLTSTATSGSNTSRNDVGKFMGAYEPKNGWKGFVTAETVKKDGTTELAAGWGGKNTADKLDALSSVTDRLILSWSDQWVTSKYKGGVPFKWASDETNLSTTQKASLGLNTATPISTSGQHRLDFIRGEIGKQGTEIDGYPATKPFRERKSRQGDIINSVVWYTGVPASNYPLSGYAGFTRDNKSRIPMLYVGGNDGMLHGFSATDGSEKIAYIPRGMISSLPLLTDPTYNNKHRYFVDGSPMSGDVDLSEQATDATDYAADWRTMLVGTLGTGGKGYFVLDVTNPTNSDIGSIAGFTETNAPKLVKLDRTRGSETPPNCADPSMSAAEKTVCVKETEEDKDIGYITARPVLDEVNPMRTTQITRMNNNRWAAVLGNGYNSTKQRPVLLIQYLDGAKELLRIPVTTETAGTGNAKDNGLSAPRLVDLNGDGRPDIAYAGDNLGNMWKFDLTQITDTSWGVAFGGSPLFTANGPTAIGAGSRPNTQPITVAPTVRGNDRTIKVGTGASAKTVPVGGMMVAFGTGRNVASKDAESVQVQTMYSVLDNTRYRIISTTQGKRIEVHPGTGTCTPSSPASCVPIPKALGAGVVTAKLAEQKITELTGGEFGTVDVKDAANDLKPTTWVDFNGWYLDFPAVGERLLKPVEFYDGSNILAVYSQVPAKGSNVDPNIESCESTSIDEERQYRTLLNIMDGKRPMVQLVDTNGDGLYNAADNNVSRRAVSKGSHNLILSSGTGAAPSGGGGGGGGGGTVTAVIPPGKIVDIDAKNNQEALALMPEESLRPSWRQLK